MYLKQWANLIFILHLAVVFIVLFGWAFPSISIIYLMMLIATLASEAFLGYCFLTKWDFDLRKKLEPNLNYDYSFLNYYGYKLIGDKFPGGVVRPAALVFLIASIIIYFYRY